jgi:predicted 2-oxoglutarate/Fe(II)-dependent dioxygenase YbiX
MFTNPEKTDIITENFTDKDLIKVDSMPESATSSNNVSPTPISTMLSITSTPLFTSEQCKSIIDSCIEELWSPVKITGTGKIQSATSQRVRGSIDSFPFVSFREAIVAANLEFYHFELLGLIDNDYPQIVKYSKTNFYSMHTEINPAMTTRKLSFLITLNDPSEYTGGEIEFLNTELDHETVNTPGTMIVFPSFLPFSISPVKKGNKFIISGNIHGNSYK